MMKNKKLIIILIGSVLFIVLGVLIYFIFFDTKKEKINVYLFWGDGCPHCEHAKEYFSSDEYDKYYNLVEYEVWYKEDNKVLMTKVSEELGATGSGVPLIVIGNKYFRGYSSRLNEEIEETIISQYENEAYVDIVEKVK